MEEINTELEVNLTEENSYYIDIKNGTKKVLIKNQFLDISNGLEKTPILFPIKFTTKLIRTKFDYKSNYIVKSLIKNGNIDEYKLTKEYSCLCIENCIGEKCDCVISHVQRYECNDNCECVREICKNRIVQNGIKKRLKIDYINKEKGFGVFTLNKIKQDDFVCEYIGEIINKENALDRINLNLLKRKPNYVLQIRENYEKMIINTFIDAENYGNVSRFLNHSCDPNLYFDIVRINHFIPQVGFFAIRDIEENEELTFSYCETNENKDEEYKTSYKSCLCGAEKCIKYLPS